MANVEDKSIGEFDYKKVYFLNLLSSNSKFTLNLSFARRCCKKNYPREQEFLKNKQRQTKPEQVTAATAVGVLFEQ
jgi:hypothetical protein